MAQMSKCCICKYYNFQSGKCNYYDDLIPKEIFLELTMCKHFFLQKSEEDNTDMPTAKGR